MRNTTVTWLRNKNIVRTGLPVQISNMSFRMAADLGGQSPYDSYWISTTGGGHIEARRGDLLIDEGPDGIDPLTNAATQYRIFGNPEIAYSSHTKMPSEKVMGT